MNPSAAPANPNTSHSGADRTPITIPAVTAPREPKRIGVMALKSRRRSRAMTARETDTETDNRIRPGPHDCRADQAAQAPQ